MEYLITLIVVFAIGWVLVDPMYRRNVFSPFYIALAGFLYYFFIPFFVFFNEPWRNVSDLNNISAFAIILLGFCVAIFVPRMSLKNRVWASLNRNLDLRLIKPSVVIALYLLSCVLGFLISNRTQGSGFFSNLLALFVEGSLALPLIAAFSVSSVRRVAPKILFISLVTVAVLLALFLIFGSERRTVLRVLIYFLVGINFSLVRVPIFAVVLFAAVSPVLVYFLRIEQAARAWYGVGVGEISLSEFQEIEQRWRSANMGRISNAFLASSDATTAYSNTLLIIDKINAEEMVYGQTYIRPIFSLIPREFWESKPVPLISRIRWELPVNAKAPHQSISILGEAWWNFGIIGIVVIPGVLFAFMKGMYSFSGAQRVAKPQFLYMIGVPFFLEVFRGGSDVIMLTFIATLGFVVFARLCNFLVSLIIPGRTIRLIYLE